MATNKELGEQLGAALSVSDEKEIRRLADRIKSNPDWTSVAVSAGRETPAADDHPSEVIDK